MDSPLWGKRVVSMKSLWAALALAIGLASLVRAEPLDSKRVPADAKWLVHIAVDTIKTGKVDRGRPICHT